MHRKPHKPRTIRNVVSTRLGSYFHGRCIYVVIAYTEAKDPCKSCDMGHRYYCGYKCGMPSDRENDRKQFVKRVFIGDTIVLLDGTEYVLVKDNNGSAWFEKKEK